MNKFGSFTLSVLLYTVLPLGLTKAAPQWHNSSDGRQYLIEGDEKYNWFDAHRECAHRQLQLVEIDTPQKNQALVELLTSIFGDYHDLWLGAMNEHNIDKDIKRPFYWFSSGKLMNFSYWANNNPDKDRAEEHCVHTFSSASDYRWNDNHCHVFRFGFICEEHYLHESLAKSFANKQKTLLDVISQLRMYQEHQQPHREKLEKAMQDLEDGENHLKQILQSIETNLEFNANHAQNQTESKSVTGDKSKQMLIWGMVESETP